MQKAMIPIGKDESVSDYVNRLFIMPVEAHDKTISEIFDDEHNDRTALLMPKYKLLTLDIVPSKVTPEGRIIYYPAIDGHGISVISFEDATGLYPGCFDADNRLKKNIQNHPNVFNRQFSFSPGSFELNEVDDGVVTLVNTTPYRITVNITIRYSKIADYFTVLTP